MRTVLIGILLLSGIIFVASVMLMSPKGGLGIAVGGVASSNEYGSKKSLENTLKRAALVSLVIFIVVTIFLPYSS